MSDTLQTQTVDGSYAVDTSAGTPVMRVSSEWYNRPDDQRFCSLDELMAHTSDLRDVSHAGAIESNKIRVLAGNEDNPDDLRLVFPEKTLRDTEVAAKPTHWSFGQIASLVKAPPGYLRTLPAAIAGINLQHGLMHERTELVKTLVSGDGEDAQVRAFTGPKYGRIYDHEIVQAVHNIAGNGLGEARWKIPGQLDWSTGTYNPNTAVTKETTTLFASDRDVFMFLADDRNPIEIGKLPDGKPDLLFRGFFVYNSEVGSKSFGLATMYLRGVCANRILWGVEKFQEVCFRHSSGAPDRFAKEVMPALQSYAEASTGKLLAGINDARRTVVADDEAGQLEFLARRKFTHADSAKIIKSVTENEGHEPSSIWDFVQGISAVARDKGRQDERVSFERQATRLLPNTN